MRIKNSTSRAGVCHQFCADLGELVSLPWFRDVRVDDVDDEFVCLEPPCVPSVALGRALSAHLKLCGVLDGYDYSVGSVVEAPDCHECKLDYEVEFKGAPYQMSLVLRYEYRDPRCREAAVGLSEAEIVQYLMKRIVLGDRGSPVTAMKFTYIFAIRSLKCTLNGLEVLL